MQLRRVPSVELTILGGKGACACTPPTSTRPASPGDRDAGRKTKRKLFKKRDQVAPELDELAACIRDDREPEPSGAEGLADMRVIEAIARAAAGRSQSLAPATRRARPSKAQGIRRKPHGMPDLVNAEPPGRD